MAELSQKSACGFHQVMHRAGRLSRGKPMFPGEFITENIRLESPLGSGGMGSVWRAFHNGLGIAIAVKFVAPGATSEAFERFRREARLAASARHANVVQILDYGVARNGQPYIGMELLEGQDLGQWLQSFGGRIPFQQVSAILKQACAGLTRAHSKGIVHRDIKPENLFICEEEGTLCVKILDFGVARGPLGLTARGQVTNGLVGTALYMSPEQIMSGLGPVDSRADLWALAVVCYVCLTGCHPFGGNSIGALALAIDSCRFIAPSTLSPDVPKGVNSWMLRALSRDPIMRFQTARELTREFDRAAGISVGSAAPVDASAESGGGHYTAPPLVSPTPVEGILPNLAQAKTVRVAERDSGWKSWRKGIRVGALSSVLGLGVLGWAAKAIHSVQGQPASIGSVGSSRSVPISAAPAKSNSNPQSPVAMAPAQHLSAPTLSGSAPASASSSAPSASTRASLSPRLRPSSRTAPRESVVPSAPPTKREGGVSPGLNMELE